jgi:hypothetical protein
MVAEGLVLHPVPSGGLEEKPSVLSTTPLWGPIDVTIALGFVLCFMGGLRREGVGASSRAAGSRPSRGAA